MDLKEFERLFIEECERNNINIESVDIEKFYNYMLGIIDWNDKINVTAITDKKEFLVKHFIDSLTISRFVEDGKRLIDIGTGAGFPGIPLKIAYPNMQVTLIDSVNKKLNVIREVSNNIKLDKLEIIHSRAEDLANNPKYREQYDYVTTRAVSNLSTISEYMIPFLKIGGKAICMKGPNYEEELKEAEKAINILGGKIERIENLLISGEIERNIIIISKIKSTPNKYPRGQGKPLREPIK
ncbi:MAG: 16S rRNA (guanine(527)-N(7))-methyltransferase RsmG [Clostridia bacterium]|nr:16S rRNA (guanine(527)-N(7))-methyltransferase RsmG [Clostridia bacterium]